MTAVRRTNLLPTVLVVCAVALLLAFMGWLSAVFVPLGIGVVLAFVLAPAVDWLQRWTRSRTRAAVVLLLSFGVLALGIAGAAVPMIAGEVRHWRAAMSGEGLPAVRLGSQIVDYGAYADPDATAWSPAALAGDAQRRKAPTDVVRVLAGAGLPAADGEKTLAEAVGDLDGDGQLDPGYGRRAKLLAGDRTTWLGDVVYRLEKAGVLREAERSWRNFNVRDQVRKALAGDGLSTAGDVGRRVVDSLGAWAAMTVQLALAIALIPLYAFVFLLAMPRWRERLPLYLPRASREKWLHVLRRIGTAISAFVRGRLVVCGIVGLVTAIGWAALGVRLGFLAGLAVGVLTIVPLASVLALLPVLLMALLDVGAGAHSGGWLFGVIAVFAFGQVLESVLNPLVVGDAVQLDLVTTLVALLIGGAVAGFFGLLVAVPVAATVRILLDELVLPRWRAWAEGDGQV